MGLDIAQQARLIKRFAPVLFLNSQEVDFPVRPEAFIERSALWSARIPYDEKMLWGQGINGFRSPLIPRGGISLNPIDPLLVEPTDAELWLETSGWARDEIVEASTDNRTCNPLTPSDPYQLAIDGPWFYAEVCDSATIAYWFDFQTVREQVGLDWWGFQEAAGSLNIICYYFLFPRHIEPGIVARADGSLEPSGNYEGNWACFCVVARQGDELTGNDEPLFAGFSRRRRGSSGDFGGEFVQEYMEFLPWGQVPTASDHAGVKVSLGTHNLYPIDGDQGEPGGIRPQWFDWGSSASEPATKLAKDSVENPAAAASSAVTLAKILAGLGIAGPIGALIGAIAGAAEAADIHKALDEKPELKPGDGEPPEWPNDLQDPRDKLQDASESQAIVPQGQEGLVLSLTGAAPGTNVSFWIDDSEQTVVDRGHQLFWPDQISYGIGYKGRWGVRCSDDPFSRRAGGRFPEFRLQILKRLVAAL